MSPLFDKHKNEPTEVVTSHRAPVQPAVEKPALHPSETAYQRAAAGEQVVFPMPQEDQLPQSDSADEVQPG